jgi:hypothetical protein
MLAIALGRRADLPRTRLDRLVVDPKPTATLLEED